MRSRRAVFSLAVLGLVAWCAFGCAVEVYRCGWLRYADPWSAEEPGTWRFLSRHVAEMRAFLDDVEGHLPVNAQVAISSEPGEDRERLFRALWTAYLLPEHRVRHVRVARDGLDADYWIAYGTHLRHPRLRRVAETGRGTLYRVAPERPAPGRVEE